MTTDRRSWPGKRILLIDDQPAFRQQARFLLEMEGFDVTVAADGQAALDLLEGGFTPDLILTDVMMPRMSGFELSRAIGNLQKLAGTPIVFVTARDRSEDPGETNRLANRRYLGKPFDPEELLEIVRHHLDSRDEAQGEAGRPGSAPGGC